MVAGSLCGANQGWKFVNGSILARPLVMIGWWWILRRLVRIGRSIA